MRITDCFWEIANIGKRTVEIVIEHDDTFDRSHLLDAIDGYEYAVVKVPMNHPTFNIGLTDMSFSCIETQLSVSKRVVDFDTSKVEHLTADTEFETVMCEDDVQSILDNITLGMFSTDRVALDPHLGPALSLRRYKNWLSTEAVHDNTLLIKELHKGQHIGFMLLRKAEDGLVVLLNGLYKPYQRKGLGLLTPASPLMYIQRNNLHYEEVSTNISSNNVPVVKLYNRLGFTLDYQTYVFIKHIDAK
jgi:hypothetical protein